MSAPLTAGAGPRIFRGMRPLDRAGALRDSVAGVELAAMNIPQALGYTSIAGTPAVTGLYTLLLPLISFAAFGASRYLVVSADSATAAILAGGVSHLATAGSVRYVELASLTALLTGGLLLLARLLGLGFLADFLSQTVLVGFLTGVGFQVGIGVLPEMLGLASHSRRPVLQLWQLFENLPHLNWDCLGLSAGVVILVLILGKLAPRVPAPMLAVAGAIGASAAWNFAGHGIEVLGPVTGGLPYLHLPPIHWKDVDALMPVAGSCMVMILAQSAATARIYAVRHHQVLDEDADLMGLAAANAAAGLSGAFVVNGSPTQTAMVESAGGRSQVAHFTTAAVVALVLLLFTHPLQYLPKSVLGAIIFVVAVRLVDLRGMWEIRSESPQEFWLAVFTAAVVVGVGVEQGIILAMVISLLRIVEHGYRPHTAVLVQDEAGIWQLIPATPGAVTEPGLVIYRFGAALFYANAGRFSDEIRALVGPSPSKVRWMMVDAGAIARIDYSAARVLRELKQNLSERNVELVFAHVQSDLKPDLVRHHLVELLGANRIFERLRDAVAAFHQSPKAP